MPEYDCYGLILCSAVPLPCMRETARSGGPRLVYTPCAENSLREPESALWPPAGDGEFPARVYGIGGSYLICVEGVGSYRVSWDGGAVYGFRAAGCADEAYGRNLLELALPLAVQLRGQAMFRGSAVILGGRAVVLLGEPGRNTGALTAALCRRGAALIGAGAVAAARMRSETVIAGGARRLTIPPATAGPTAAGRSMDWHEPAWLAAPAYAAPAAIYLLTPHAAASEEGSRGSRPAVSEAGAGQGFRRLHGPGLIGTLASRLYHLQILPPPRWKEQLERCTRLARIAPVYEISPPGVEMTAEMLAVRIAQRTGVPREFPLHEPGPCGGGLGGRVSSRAAGLGARLS